MTDAADLFERMRPLRERFVGRAADDRAAIVQGYAAGDDATLRDICHRLAGNAGLFGFAELSAGARRAEQALLDGAAPGARAAAIEELLAQLAALPDVSETPAD